MNFYSAKTIKNFQKRFTINLNQKSTTSPETCSLKLHNELFNHVETFHQVFTAVNDRDCIKSQLIYDNRILFWYHAVLMFTKTLLRETDQTTC